MLGGPNYQPGGAPQQLFDLPLCSKVLPILLENCTNSKLVPTIHHSSVTSTLQENSVVILVICTSRAFDKQNIYVAYDSSQMFFCSSFYELVIQ